MAGFGGEEEQEAESGEMPEE